MTDTVSMRSAELELEILSYFVSFFDAILQAGLLDTGYLDGTKKLPSDLTYEMNKEEQIFYHEQFKEEFNKIYSLWKNSCGFWHTFRITNIVGRYWQKHAVDPRVPHLQNFAFVLENYLSGHISSVRKK